MLWGNNRALDLTAPTVTSPSSISVDEGQSLNYTVTADKEIDSIRFDGGPDDDDVSIQGLSIVDWTAGFLPDYGAPADADANNQYVIWLVVRGTNGVDSSRFVLTITVNDVVGGSVGAASLSATAASDSEIVVTPAATGAESYEIEIDGSGVWEAITLDAAGEGVIANLSSSTEYSLKARGKAGGITGAESSAQLATTQAVPAFYPANAVVFDGTDRLTRGGGLTGIADGKAFSFICTMEPTGGGGTDRTLFHSSNDYLQIRISSGDRLEIRGLNALAVLILHLITNEVIPISNGYVNILVAVDLATDSTEVWLNGVKATFTTRIATNDTIDMTRSDWGVGGRVANTQLFTGRMSDVAFHTSFLDFSTLANRRKVIRANGQVRDPGADGTNWFGTASMVLLSDDTAAWHTNKGTGGGFTLTGALTTAASGPNGALGTSVTPFRTDDFVEMIGVQTHPNYTDAMWSSTGWRAVLGDLHVRYTRGQWFDSQSKAHLAAIYSTYGIKAGWPFNFWNADGTFDTAKVNSRLTSLKNTGAEKFWNVEGANEYTNGNLNERAFSANASTDVLTTTTSIIKVAGSAAITDSTANHGLPNGQAVQLTTTGTLPAPFQPLTVYYVRDASGATLKLAATSGGAAINVTTTGTGTHRISRWAPLLRDYQSYLFSAVTNHADAGVRALKVGGPTLYRRVKEHYQALGVSGGCTNTAHWAGLHLYQGGRKPSLYAGDTGNDPIIQAMQDAQLACSKPVYMSETGFSTAAPNVEVNEDVAACYILRHLAEHMWLKVNSGNVVEKVGWYQLLNEDGHGDYGLVDGRGGTPPYTKRLYYYSLRNFLFRMKNATWNGSAWSYPTFTPGTLTVDINLNGNSDVRYVVAQKSTGTLSVAGNHYIVLWLDSLLWERSTDTDLMVFTADAGTDELTVPGGMYGQMATGTPCTVNSSGTVPGPLAVDTTYWIIKTATANKLKLATSLANAQANSPINVTSAGTGVHRITPRATVNVQANSPTFTTMNIFEPAVLRGESADGKRDTARATNGTPNNAINLHVPAHMMIVELVP